MNEVSLLLSDVPAEILSKIDLGVIIKHASSRAVGGGIAGASAAAVQVLSLMWIRTAMNYQYRYGGSTIDALVTLYKEGGIQRLYRGWIINFHRFVKSYFVL